MRLLKEIIYGVRIEEVKGNTNIAVESISFDVGLKLNVKQGALKGSEGIVIYQTKNEVVLRLGKLGMSLVARVPKFNVESINL